MTKEEIEKDLQDSHNDIHHLKNIIDGIESFMYSASGEDRSFLRVDLYKWRGLLNQAIILHKRIEDTLAKTIT